MTDDELKQIASMAYAALKASQQANESALAAMELARDMAITHRNATAVQHAAIAEGLARARGGDAAGVFEAARARFAKANPADYRAEQWGAVPEWLSAMREGPEGRTAQN